MNEAVLTEKDCLGDELDEPGGYLSYLSALTALRRARHPAATTETQRIYTYVAPYPFEPTRDKFKIIHNDVVGDGVIALVDFNPGDIVFRFSGKILPYQTLFTLQIEPGKYVEDPLVMGKVLHSCDPNMICSMALQTFWACKPIKAGDYLFMDYESTEDELFRSFDCCCGSDHCRGQIRGRRFLTEEVRQTIQTVGDVAHVTIP